MSEFHFSRLADGSTRCFNPAVAEEVWTVPGRGARPITNRPRHEVRPLAKGIRHEEGCAFCPRNIMHTPAEKSRLLRNGQLVDSPEPARTRIADALFRRVPNLYEIVSWDFWKSVHGLGLNDKQQARLDAWLKDPQGRAHLAQVVREKMKHLGQVDVKELSIEDLSRKVEAFFGGSHDLVVAGDHYVEGAASTEEVMGSGDLSAEDHLAFIDYAFQAAGDILRENAAARWVALFQNWRSPSGASFDHLHKQVMGMDVLPPGLLRRRELEKKEAGWVNRRLLPVLKHEKLALAENRHALAVVEPGHAYPCLVVYSKSAQGQWPLLSADEKKDLADLLGRLHRCMGSSLPINEEWLWAAGDGPPIPLQVALKWRINIPAGFEGGARVLLNPLDPWETRDRALEGLRKDRPGPRLGKDCDFQPGCLAYAR